jgi:hypothetical protein
MSYVKHRQPPQCRPQNPPGMDRVSKWRRINRACVSRVRRAGFGANGVASNLRVRGSRKESATKGCDECVTKHSHVLLRMKCRASIPPTTVCSARNPIKKILLAAAFELLSDRGEVSPKRWQDDYLAAFAQAAGLTLVTFDQTLARRVFPSILLRED